ncbi:MAG: hypothetical protein HQ581_23555 [Planctomycetes bacterium]|nr:hypothetical protein [Planctomycetota bacterium]
METSNIVTCTCGAKVRLPEQKENRAFRCPVCKTGIALTVDARVLASSQSRPGDSGATCPICQSGIAAEEFVVICPECDQVHHRECWAEVGGCGSYGCSQVPALEKGDAAAQQPMSAWGDKKTCPVCGEEIKAIAVRCRYCRTDFDTVDPLTMLDVRRGIRRKEASKGLQQTVIVVFIVSLLVGCLAPITAVVSFCLFLPKKKELARAGPVYQTLAYSAMGLSVLYSILMLLFALAP